jgi:uncharacterized protein (TIGR02466 family)
MTAVTQNIMDLFPVPVSFSHLGRELTDAELAFILSRDKRPNIGNTTSTDRDILANEELTDVRLFIESALAGYFKAVQNPKDAVTLYITQSWANYTEPGEYHHRHDHPNSFISGVFYPQADSTIDKIHFFKRGYEYVKIKPDEWNHWNSQTWWFHVGAGDLVLFPSHLEHMVETAVGGKTRVSIAFNTFLKGYLGIDENLTALQLSGGVN